MIFYKYCANGNDFLLFHTLFTQGDYASLARAVCERHSGIGADGLVALMPFSGDGIAYQWDFYNADGSRANMCGNASRCVAHYAYNLGLAPSDHSFITHSSMQAQVIRVRVNGEVVSSNLGLYRNLFALSALPSNAVQALDSSYLPISLLNAAKWFYIDTGVPHLVCFVQDLALVTESSAATKAFMQELRKSFNANVNLAYAASSDEIYLATYERGVEGITLACGTGMAATLLVGHKVYGLDSSATLIPPSGDRLKLWCESLAKGDLALRTGLLLKNSNQALQDKVLSQKSCHKQVDLESQSLDSRSDIPTLEHINDLESNAYFGDMEVFLEGEVRCVAVCHKVN